MICNKTLNYIRKKNIKLNTKYIKTKLKYRNLMKHRNTLFLLSLLNYKYIQQILNAVKTLNFKNNHEIKFLTNQFIFFVCYKTLL